MKPVQLLLLLFILTRPASYFSRDDEEIFEFSPVEYIKTRSLAPRKEKQTEYRVIRMRNPQFIDLGHRVTKELWDDVENSEFSYVLHVSSEDNGELREKLLEMLFKWTVIRKINSVWRKPAQPDQLSCEICIWALLSQCTVEGAKWWRFLMQIKRQLLLSFFPSAAQNQHKFRKLRCDGFY